MKKSLIPECLTQTYKKKKIIHINFKFVIYVIKSYNFYFYVYSSCIFFYKFGLNILIEISPYLFHQTMNLTLSPFSLSKSSLVDHLNGVNFIILYGTKNESYSNSIHTYYGYLNVTDAFDALCYTELNSLDHNEIFKILVPNI